MQPPSRKIFLHPGEFVFAEAGTQVHTILGSCVAICLWHPLLRIGGMCHFVLPTRPAGTPSAVEPDGRYGEEAMRLFDQGVKMHCTEYSDYQGKIFGGARTFSNNQGVPDELVGKRNITQAKHMLLSRNVDLKTVHVSDAQHQRIVMDFSTGYVWVRNPPTQSDACVLATG